MTRRKRPASSATEEGAHLISLGWTPVDGERWTHPCVSSPWPTRMALDLENEDKRVPLCQRRDPWKSVRHLSVSHLLESSRRLIAQPSHPTARPLGQSK